MFSRFTVYRYGIAQMLFPAWSVFPRRLVLNDFFLPSEDLLALAVERKRVSSPKLCLANEATSRLMTSIEDVLSTELGSVNPRSCQRIFGLWADFFFPALRLFQTEARFMERPSVQTRSSSQWLSDRETQ